MMRAALECAHRGWGECCIIGEHEDGDENEYKRDRNRDRESSRTSQISWNFSLIMT